MFFTWTSLHTRARSAFTLKCNQLWIKTQQMCKSVRQLWQLAGSEREELCVFYIYIYIYIYLFIHPGLYNTRRREGGGGVGRLVPSSSLKRGCCSGTNTFKFISSQEFSRILGHVVLPIGMTTVTWGGATSWPTCSLVPWSAIRLSYRDKPAWLMRSDRTRVRVRLLFWKTKRNKTKAIYSEQ